MSFSLFIAVATLAALAQEFGTPPALGEFYCMESQKKEAPLFFPTGEFCGQSFDGRKDGSGICVQKVLCKWMSPEQRKNIGPDTISLLKPDDAKAPFRRWLESTVVCKGIYKKDQTGLKKHSGECPPPNECKADTFFVALPNVELGGTVDPNAPRSFQWQPTREKPRTGENNRVETDSK